MPPKKTQQERSDAKRSSAAESSQGRHTGGAHTGITAEVRAWRRDGIAEQEIRRRLKDKGLKKSNISQIMKKTAPEGTLTCTVWSDIYRNVNPNYYCMF